MSSTNRGGQRSPSDWYSTPSWCVHRLLEAVTLPGGRWLEPGCGEGHIIRAVRERRSDVQFTGIDCRDTEFVRKATETPQPGDEFVVGDLLTPEGRVKALLDGPKWAVSVGNPPFSLAQQFIDLSLKAADTVILLLRLNYLSSDKRAEFMRTNAPDVYVLPNRPSFTGDGSTDSIDYAWFLWASSAPKTRGALQVLATTPKELRK